MTDTPLKEALAAAREVREVIAFNWAANTDAAVLHPDLLAMIEQAALTTIGRAVARERDTSAQFCDERSAWAAEKLRDDGADLWATYANACDDCAEVIRAGENLHKPQRDAQAVLARERAERARLRKVVEAARRYRDAETDGTPRLWRGKDLQDLANTLDEALAELDAAQEPSDV
ncbi:MAG TPA: hypothetical protein VFA12_20645 [Stellaceae bacterium]|nr:hypothetical protein [Stellaceae bacterium]